MKFGENFHQSNLHVYDRLVYTLSLSGHLLLIRTVHITLLTFLQQMYLCDGEDALLVSMVTIILAHHQSCKQQQVRMSPCGEEDREEENRREGSRAIFTTCIHDSCLWNVSEHTNCSYNITLCPSSSGVNESAIPWISTPLYKAIYAQPRTDCYPTTPNP